MLRIGGRSAIATSEHFAAAGHAGQYGANRLRNRLAQYLRRLVLQVGAVDEVLFYALFKHDDLVIDKWFALQATTPDLDGGVLPKVRQLLLHPDFHIRNPNRARSLLSAYCTNPSAFHRTDAAGYVFWSERVLELDAFNPQVAARLAPR